MNTEKDNIRDPFLPNPEPTAPVKPESQNPQRRVLRGVISKNGGAMSPAEMDEEPKFVNNPVKRRRGRPPRDPSLPPREKTPPSGRPRGRPAKISPALPIGNQPLPPPVPWSEQPSIANKFPAEESKPKATKAEPKKRDEPVHIEVDQSEHQAQGSSSVPSTHENLPATLYVLPIHNRPIMPGITVPLTFQGEIFVKVLQEVADSPEKMLGVSLVKNANQDSQDDTEMFTVGTALKLVRVMVTEDGVQVLARAMHRIECTQTLTKEPASKCAVNYRRDLTMKPTEEIRAYSLAIISQVKDLLNLSPLFQEQLKMLVSHLDYENPGLTMDLITAMTTAEAPRVQDILETFDIIERAKKVLQLLSEEIEIQKLQVQIKSQIDDKISVQQKEFFLREQLKVIKKELGIEKDEKSADIEAFREKFAKLTLSDEARKVVDEELNKLSLLEPQASEFPLIRGYLNWFAELPWGKTTTDNLDLKNAKTVLDATHFGLDDVKDRILEFIATIQKRGSLTGSILCLVGPPGVGKTSIGRSIADALNRKFYRFSVGGMRDEAEIKGHRRTYLGAMPGKIIQSLKRAESSNPVILIDEIDKMTANFQGDPAAALLEVLDPEQNKEFLDHYLDVRFDLSKVLFITTANSLDTIPSPLLDRMEIIKLSGYVLEEKLEIAKRHIIPHQLQEHGLKTKDLRIADKVLSQLIDQYAREAGVRNLENQVRKLCRKVARRQVEGNTASVNLDADLLHNLLGHPVFNGEELYNAGVPGVALGLAWTSMGGATLYMEATALHSAAGGFKTTGRLGETMVESAQIAYSVARSLLSQSDTKAYEFFNRHLVHLHVPEGATPKDGPSAGVTMALAIYSLATGKAIKPRLAMTGELTLTGKVLPIGGVREKVIAARRLKVMELILPKDNERDFVALPDYIRAGVKVHYANWFSDVLDAAFVEKAPKMIHSKFDLSDETKPETKSEAKPKVISLIPPAPVPAPASVKPEAKRRGRPAATKQAPKPSNVAAEPKRRGRPPVAVTKKSVAKAIPAAPKKKPGRPRK